MPYEKEVSKLAPLETFDPKVFIGDSERPQELCDFILALALAYNDFRDVTFGRILHSELPVPRQAIPSLELGEWAALRIFIIRVQIGYVHELLTLVQENKELVGTPAFSSLFKSLSKEGKEAWNFIYGIATGAESGGGLAKLLVRVRNKISFHYDQEELAKGFKHAFSNDPVTNQPFISRGDSLVGTRFYFADAAAEAYLKLRIDPDNEAAIELLWGTGELLEKVNLALNEMIVRFIQVKSGYRKFRRRE